MNKKLLGLFGLSFNPFSPELPTEAIQLTPPVESFFWKVEACLNLRAVALAAMGLAEVVTAVRRRCFTAGGSGWSPASLYRSTGAVG